MSTRTPEQRAKNAEYQRAYRTRNRERLREYDRNRERILTPEQREIAAASSRAYYATNRDAELARMREYQAQNREQVNAQRRVYRAENPDKIRAQPSRSRDAWLRRRHGMRPEDWAALWEAQGGCCYLCGKALAVEKAHIDHDHSCRGPDRSCSLCRRGLACEQCNRAIGLAGDDPARLRRMANALEAAMRGVAERKAFSEELTEQLRLL